ncbi:MAG: thiamine pyrophosphate-binding protein [Rhodobacter sp.]|nr:thiamine pyrophosphate-binding protein [Rhodobacter sp.]
MPQRAADLLAACLVAQGADRLFCVPGESYLALLDALYDLPQVDVVVCRHEGGAGMMAVADAKLTGRPGLAAVSRGPGATNAAIAVHLAEQDAVPLVLLVGQVARHERGRGAFQEMDYGAVFGTVAKAVWEVWDAAHLPEIVARAFHTAAAGTPGPVVISLPEDMLGDVVDAEPVPPQPLPRTGPGPGEIVAVVERLSAAERPLVIAGGGLAATEGRSALANLARRCGLPVATTFKHQEIFDNAAPYFAGNLGFKIPQRHVDTLAEADLILAIGTRLGDVPTQGFTFPVAPRPAQTLVHVWPDPAVLGRVYRTDLAVPCDPVLFCAALADAAPEADRGDWRQRVRRSAMTLRAPPLRPVTGGVDFGAVVSALARQAPRDSIVATDSGNFSSWVHAFWPWDGSQTAIGAVGGAMGLGVPGAVAAAMRHPDRTVLGFVGDGGALMTGQELATGIAHGAKPKIVISDNSTYGTIRLHQERAYPERVVGTDLANPDFAAWARAFGAFGRTVSDVDGMDDAVAELLAHDGAAVLHVKSSAEAISAFTTITALRGAPTSD